MLHNRSIRSWLTVLIALGAIALFTPGCTSKSGDKSGNGSGEGHSHEDGDDHDHGADDHDHDHAGDDADEHGEEFPLGTGAAGGVTMAVSQFGKLAGGSEMAFEVDVTAGEPSSIRVWIGTANGIGSMKAKAEKEGEHYHAHVETPAIIIADHALWVEVENAAGKREKASFPLHR